MTQSSARGFTLIEMVIAFAILGLTLTVLYGVFEGSLSRIRHDTLFREGTLLAQSLLARTGTEWPLADGTHNGESEGFRYVIDERIERPLSAQPPFILPTMLIVASVSWSEASGTHSVSISTLKFMPPIVQ